MKERTQDIIMNLKCPTLTYFRWYKDTFFSLIFQRDDSILEFWKERFLAGFMIRNQTI